MRYLEKVVSNSSLSEDTGIYMRPSPFWGGSWRPGGTPRLYKMTLDALV